MLVTTHGDIAGTNRAHTDDGVAVFVNAFYQGFHDAP